MKIFNTLFISIFLVIVELTLTSRILYAELSEPANGEFSSTIYVNKDGANIKIQFYKTGSDYLPSLRVTIKDKNDFWAFDDLGKWRYLWRWKEIQNTMF